MSEFPSNVIITASRVAPPFLTISECNTFLHHVSNFRSTNAIVFVLAYDNETNQPVCTTYYCYSTQSIKSTLHVYQVRYFTLLR